MADNKPATKKFGKGERSIPHHTQKASKYYPAVDVAVAKKVRCRWWQEARERKRFSVILRDLYTHVESCDGYAVLASSLGSILERQPI
jgi:hypothetical protein